MRAEHKGGGEEGEGLGMHEVGPTFPVFTRKFGVFYRGHAEKGGSLHAPWKGRPGGGLSLALLLPARPVRTSITLEKRTDGRLTGIGVGDREGSPKNFFR